YLFPPELRNLIQGVYEFRLTDSIGTDCPRTITRSVNIANNNFYVNSDFDYERICNGAIVIDHYGSRIIRAENGTTQTPAWGGFFKIQLINASNTIVWSGQGTQVT